MYLHAQFPKPGTNVIRNYLNQFEGTWKWSNGKSELIIMLKKVNVFFEETNFHEDVIIGSHRYINNGNVIEDYLSEFQNISADTFSSIFLFSNMDGTNQTIITGNIKDKKLGKRQALKLELLTNSKRPRLKWTLESRGDVITTPNSKLGITLPIELILEKQ